MANLHEHPSEIYRSLREAIQSLEPHEHLCLIYESHEEWVNTVIPFIVTGIRKKEKCIYVVVSIPFSVIGFNSGCMSDKLLSPLLPIGIPLTIEFQKPES